MSNKAADKAAFINFQSPDKVYKSIQIVQEQHPNLKIDPRLHLRSKKGANETLMKPKLEQELASTVEIKPPSRHSSRPDSENGPSRNIK